MTETVNLEPKYAKKRNKPKTIGAYIDPMPQVKITLSSLQFRIIGRALMGTLKGEEVTSAMKLNQELMTQYVNKTNNHVSQYEYFLKNINDQIKIHEESDAA